MLKDSYEFYENESRNYKNILLNYNKDNSKVFVDENFHPRLRIKESKIKFDLYNKEIKWKRIDEIYPAPLFQKEKIHQDYINQGALGDCYFITALSRLGKENHLIESLFEKSLPDRIIGEVPQSINIKCGAVVVYLQAFGRRTPILIDTLIPTLYGSPVFSRPLDNTKSAWFCLVEKAFAKLNGSYSNIAGGFFSDSIYYICGYYHETLYINEDPPKGEQSYEMKLMNDQKYGCVMDISISKYFLKKVTKEEVESKNLLTGHSYLILDIRQVGNSYFFLIRNPHGRTVWTGDYSTGSPKWTPELKLKLGDNVQHGEFWMIGKDVFKYFTEIDISRPFNPSWKVRFCSYYLPPLDSPDLTYVRDIDFTKCKNFSFQLLQPIPLGEKAIFYILCEKRCDNFAGEFTTYSKFGIIVAHSEGKKLNSKILDKCKFINKHIFKKTTCISCQATNHDDIITFAIYYNSKSELKMNFYIRVFCKFDFKLYDNDFPDKLYPYGENPGPAFDNFSSSDPFKAIPLTPHIINGKNALWFDELDDDNFNEDRTEVVAKIINKNKQDTGLLHYSHLGSQLDLNLFKVNKMIVQGSNVNVYEITEKKTKKNLFAVISKYLMSTITNRFSEELSIYQTLKYPSIATYYGYSEQNFQGKPNPVIITEAYQFGSLSKILSIQNKDDDEYDYDDDELFAKYHGSYEKFNNTKKMINLIGIAFGMKYMHETNIIHYNLKCSNIFLDNNFYPKICNFWYSKHSHMKPDKLEENRKTYCFAPELINQEASCSFPVDVFAYGMIFYHVISNCFPMIPSVDKYDLYIKIKNGIRPDIECIPDKFRSFLNNLWNNEPKDRPTFNQIVELLTNQQHNLWLDDVDDTEVNNYISQFI